MNEFPLSAFDYELPKALIAQEPCARRDQARLLVVNRTTEAITHRHVYDLPDLLRPEDLLVFNNTKVLPARLYGRRERTGGRWEGLYLGAHGDGTWELMSQTRGTLTAGESIVVAPSQTDEASRLRLRLIEKLPHGRWLAEPSLREPPESLLQRIGHVPLPPYIRKGVDEASDRDRYQTVFAERPGAVAAPTAGLHFTPELLSRLNAAGVRQAHVTLHVGIGTFQPIQVEELSRHQMHREWGELSEPTAAEIRQCQERKARVVAIGTTTVRVLETVAGGGPIRAWSGETELFIRPPYRFRAVEVLLTNFHLPRSSLLVLVSAFAGVELIRRAYGTAIAEGYRFYSYGDAMLIL